MSELNFELGYLSITGHDKLHIDLGPLLKLTLLYGHDEYQPFDLELPADCNSVNLCVGVLYEEATTDLDKPSFKMTVETDSDELLGQTEITSRDIRCQYDWFYKTLRFAVPAEFFKPGLRQTFLVKLEASMKIWRAERPDYPTYETIKTERPIIVNLTVPESYIAPQITPFVSASNLDFKCIVGPYYDMDNVDWKNWHRLVSSSYDDIGVINIIDTETTIDWKHSFTTFVDALIKQPAKFDLQVFELGEDNITAERELFFFHISQEFNKGTSLVNYSKYFRDIQNWDWWTELEAEFRALDIIPKVPDYIWDAFELLGADLTLVSKVAIRPIGPYQKTFRWSAKISPSDTSQSVIQKNINVMVVVPDSKIQQAQYCYQKYREYLFWMKYSVDVITSVGDWVKKLLKKCLEIGNTDLLFHFLVLLIDYSGRAYYLNECSKSMFNAKYRCDIPFDEYYANKVSLPKEQKISIPDDSPAKNLAQFTSAYQLINELYEMLQKVWQKYLSALKMEDEESVNKHWSEAQKAHEMLDAAIVEMNETNQNIEALGNKNLKLGNNLIDAMKENIQSVNLSENAKALLRDRGLTEEQISDLENKFSSGKFEEIDFGLIAGNRIESHPKIMKSATDTYFEGLKIIHKLNLIHRMGEGDILPVLLGYGLLTYEEYEDRLKKVGMTNSLESFTGWKKEKRLLSEQNIFTTWQLLRSSSTRSLRSKLCEKSSIEQGALLQLANISDLMRVGGISYKMAFLLEKAGIDTVKELALRNPDSVIKKLKKAKGRQAVKMPEINEIIRWISSAKKLKRVLKY